MTTGETWFGDEECVKQLKAPVRPCIQNGVLSKMIHFLNIDPPGGIKKMTGEPSSTALYVISVSEANFWAIWLNLKNCTCQKLQCKLDFSPFLLCTFIYNLNYYCEPEPWDCLTEQRGFLLFLMSHWANIANIIIIHPSSTGCSLSGPRGGLTLA